MQRPVNDLPDPARVLREREWAEQVRHSDVDAFEQLFRTYYRPLCTFAYGFVKSRDTAEEIVQSLFTRIWLRREEWVIRSDVRTYLYGATRNQALNAVKHVGVVKRLESKVQEDGEIPAWLGRPSATIDQELDAESIWQAVAKLPERARLLLTLRWEQGMSYAEIAEIMGITPKSVEIGKARAVNMLRKLLAPHLK